ncbi:Gfo/Idh/MocA family protein [Paenibacillus sp. MBLB4367]|uniref:Gfo/Idh/MocA family protein n=1 Tax=Paenibacillus sp. MBLB4367 TaxID=3384767 RepID=UPI0039082B9B
MPGVETTAIYDIDKDKTQEAAVSFGAKGFESTMELLDSGIDALFVCSPQFARDDTEIEAVSRGIHVLVEKPLGLDLEQVIRKEKLVRESGVIHSSGYCLRYLDTVQKAKRYLEDKQTDMALAYRFGGAHVPAWWRRVELSGDQLVDQTTHQIDLIRYLAGEIDEVFAQFDIRAIRQDDSAATIYDVGTVALRLEGGAVGNVSNTCTLPQVVRSEVEITGRNFYVQLNGNSLRIVDDRQDVTELSRMDFYMEQDRRFIDAVQSRSQEMVLGSYTDALETLAVTLAANESAAVRKPLKRIAGTCLFE